MTYKTERKPDVTILPVPAVLALADALLYGETKHGRSNYLTNPVVTDRELLAALGRHWLAAIDAPDPKAALDTESGLHHVACVMANAAMLIHRWSGTQDAGPVIKVPTPCGFSYKESDCMMVCKLDAGHPSPHRDGYWTCWLP